MAAKEKFTFFWRSESPFSQWHTAKFVVDGITFNCAEQYMMYKKAELFNDKGNGEKILKSTSPKAQKALGRKVENFDAPLWTEKCYGLVKDGNLAKFSQNQYLKEELFKTAGTTLVEASPRDTIWGIGLGADNPKAKNKSTWRGKNLLGYALTEVREQLMLGESSASDLFTTFSPMDEGAGVSAGQNTAEDVAKEEKIRGKRKRKSSASTDDPQTTPYHICSEEKLLFLPRESSLSLDHQETLEIEDKIFHSVSHYMKYKQADYLGAPDIAEKLLKANDKKQKLLLKKISRSGDDDWDAKEFPKVIKEGFKQLVSKNSDILDELKRTAGYTIVIISPNNEDWGDHEAGRQRREEDSHKWQQVNRVGFILTQLREELMH